MRAAPEGLQYENRGWRLLGVLSKATLREEMLRKERIGEAEPRGMITYHIGMLGLALADGPVHWAGVAGGPFNAFTRFFKRNVAL